MWVLAGALGLALAGVLWAIVVVDGGLGAVRPVPGIGERAAWWAERRPAEAVPRRAEAPVREDTWVREWGRPAVIGGRGREQESPVPGAGGDRTRGPDRVATRGRAHDAVAGAVR